MSALIIISAAIFLVYMVAIIVRYGFPASVSDSFYLLPLKWNAAFTLFCVSVAMTLLPAWLEKSPGPLPFLSCAGLAFVGVAAKFRDDFVEKAHVWAALLCGGAAQAWIVFCTPFWYVSLAFFLACGWLAWRKRKQRIFWLETAAFLSTFLTVYFF